MRMSNRAAYVGAGVLGAAALLVAGPGRVAEASSHREAPAITKRPKVDATDFYLFRSYEAGRSDFVTIVACYQPLQAAYGGPNYFLMDPDALYEIHVDRDGDALEDVTFQFRFTDTHKGIALTVGPAGNQRTNEIPLKNAGPFGAGDTTALNVEETYTVTVVTGDRRTGTAAAATHDGGQTVFTKPADRIGAKSIPDYDAALADQQVVAIPRSDAASPVKERTDAAGHVRFRLPVAGLWLFSSVHLERAKPDEEASYRSVWASMTFEMPASTMTSPAPADDAGRVAPSR